MRAWRAIAEDDADIDPDQQALDQRHARFTESFRGGLELAAYFDPASGAPLKAAVDARERELFLADLAEARAVAGVPHDPDDHTTAGLDLPRKPAQRRCDALVELALAGAGIDTTHGVGGPKAVVNVTVPADVLADAAAERVRRTSSICLPGLDGEGNPTPVDNTTEPAQPTTVLGDVAGNLGLGAYLLGNAVVGNTGTGLRNHHRLDHAIQDALDPHPHSHEPVIDDLDTPIGHDLLELLACDCILRRITLDLNGVPTDLGRDQRLVSRAQRRLLRQRDGGCAFPGCDRPPSWCDAHHIIPWEIGGPTNLDNLVLLCRRHHGYMHRREAWLCRINTTTRRPEFFKPDGTRVPEPVLVRPPDRSPPDGRPPDLQFEHAA
jgi:hypothetical protein